VSLLFLLFFAFSLPLRTLRLPSHDWPRDSNSAFHEHRRLVQKFERAIELAVAARFPFAHASIDAAISAPTKKQRAPTGARHC
jgi:hypothetical protein